MIIISEDFHQFSAKKLAVFLKTNVMIIFFCLHGFNLNKNRQLVLNFSTGKMFPKL
jgi:hypothetical protein